MTYELIVKPEAEADIEESFIWYEDQSVGLGKDFRRRVTSDDFSNQIKPAKISQGTQTHEASLD